ncbi:hypothetical protein V8G54_009558 [Vigna mungo]|uniref:14-3-3 domain-containing protein n=1 Tax=Vigna mungo TaxID=3915 RepID=A0AAQ3S5K8_VIGMU
MQMSIKDVAVAEPPKVVVAEPPKVVVVRWMRDWETNWCGDGEGEKLRKRWGRREMGGDSPKFLSDSRILGYIKGFSHALSIVFLGKSDEEPAESQRGDMKFLQVARPYCLDKWQTTYSMKDFSSYSPGKKGSLSFDYPSPIPHYEKVKGAYIRTLCLFQMGVINFAVIVDRFSYLVRELSSRNRDYRIQLKEKRAMEGRLDGRLRVVENKLEAMEIAVDEIRVENVALCQDTMAIRQDLQEVMRILGGRVRDQEGIFDGSQASVNANRRARREDEIGGRDGARGESHDRWRKRLELSLFKGLDPLNWINRAEKFFKVQGVLEEEKDTGSGLENEDQEPILGRVEGCVGNEVWGSKQRGGLGAIIVRPRFRESGGADKEVAGGTGTGVFPRRLAGGYPKSSSNTRFPSIDGRHANRQSPGKWKKTAREIRMGAVGGGGAVAMVESNRSSEETEQNRCAEMGDVRKKIAKLDVDRSVKERNLVSWRILSWIEQKEESKGNELNVKRIRNYRHNVERELSNSYSAVRIILEEHLIPSTNIAGPRCFIIR